MLRAEVQRAREGLEVESWATWRPGCPSGAQGLRHKHKDGSLWKHSEIRDRFQLEGTTAASKGILGDLTHRGWETRKEVTQLEWFPGWGHLAGKWRHGKSRAQTMSITE